MVWRGCSLLLLTAAACGLLRWAAAEVPAWAQIGEPGGASPRATATQLQQRRLEAPMPAAERLQLREAAREMFYHGFNNYMLYAFPHDELLPISRGWVDSLAELGDAAPNPNSTYKGGAAVPAFRPLELLAGPH